MSRTGEQQQRLSSSISNPLSEGSVERSTHAYTTNGDVLDVVGQKENHLRVKGRGPSETTEEYSLYSLYSMHSMYSLHTLYTADGSSETPITLSTEGGSSYPRRGRGSQQQPRRRPAGSSHEANEEDERYRRTATPPTGRPYGEDPEFDAVERRAREALEAIAMKDESVMIRLPEYLETLRRYRRECSRRSMYKEAHLVQQVLRNLRLEEEARHIRGLTEHQMTERMRMEDVHREEFRAFHARWNSIIDHFEEAQLEEEITMLERHNDELMAFHEEMREFNPRVLRFSKALVHSRLKQHTLARQRNYARALEVKDEADGIETTDIERFENTKNTLYGRRERALRRRHQQELSAMRYKVESRRNFLERNRKRELDEMLQRYINARRELETHQNIIRSKTGTILLKHACNTKTDTSGSQAIIMSAESGAFGSTIQAQQAQREQQGVIEDRQREEDDQYRQYKTRAQEDGGFEEEEEDFVEDYEEDDAADSRRRHPRPPRYEDRSGDAEDCEGDLEEEEEVDDEEDGVSVPSCQ